MISQEGRERPVLAVHPGGTAVVAQWPGADMEQLRLLYELTGADAVEPVVIDDRVMMWADEYGLDKELAPNASAVRVAVRAAGGVGYAGLPIIVGTVVFTGPHDGSGGVLPLDESALTNLVHVSGAVLTESDG